MVWFWELVVRVAVSILWGSVYLMVVRLLSMLVSCVSIWLSVVAVEFLSRIRWVSPTFTIFPAFQLES